MYTLTCAYMHNSEQNWRMNLFCLGDFEKEQRRGRSGVPGVLSSGGCAVAQPDCEATPGGIHVCEGAEEKGRHGHHCPVRE